MELQSEFSLNSIHENIPVSGMGDPLPTEKIRLARPTKKD